MLVGSLVGELRAEGVCGLGARAVWQESGTARELEAGQRSHWVERKNTIKCYWKRGEANEGDMTELG